MIPAMKSLTEKLDRQAELRAKLEASLALAGFEPRAFEHGACKVGAIPRISEEDVAGLIRAATEKHEV